MKLPVYKSTVMHYAMRLLSGTKYALLFATVKDDGEKLHYSWDMVRAGMRPEGGRLCASRRGGGVACAVWRVRRWWAARAR